MNQKQFFREGKWMPSFSLFGNREIVYHHPVAVEGQHSNINRLLLNQSYPAQQYLASKLCKQTYTLTKAFRKASQNTHTILIQHLRNMMSYVTKVETECYHNILYLTLKYLAYLVTKEATQKSVVLEEEVSLQSWLSDIHAIYFQTEDRGNILLEGEIQQQLLSLLKQGDYQQMISKLRCIYCTIQQSDKQTLEKIDFIISILLIKINSKAISSGQSQGTEQQFSNLSQKLVQKYKEKFSHASDKKQGKKKGAPDVYTFIGKVLIGEQGAHEKIADKSWPIYIINQTNFGNPRFQKPSISTLATNFIGKVNNYGRASIKETEYLLKLLNGENSHHIYQRLFQIVPPFYAHLMGYFLSFIQPNPIASVFVEDYSMDIVRNLLDHGSQISFECLIVLYGTFEETSIAGDKLAEIFQPLLVQHLCVIDDSDAGEMNDLLSKVRLMWLLNLERYAYSQLNLLLNNLLQRGILNREVLLIYAYCSLLFNSYYNYEELLVYYLEEIFISRSFSVDFLQEYRLLKNQLQGNRDKRLLKELTRIESLFDKFYRLERVLRQQDVTMKIDQLVQLMQRTYRSVSVLGVIEHILQQLVLTPTNLNVYNLLEPNHRGFINEVRQFLAHYPPERGDEEARIIARLNERIG